tara:strand:+ start:827 stop:4141 length:3315 start_codon:yes stop_codon:yes gene_type:complete
MTIELVKNIEEIIDTVSIRELSAYQDSDHKVDLAVKYDDGEDIFFVKRDGAVLYAGADGAKAASMFYSQIAQIHEEACEGMDPQFATLREILEARNKHVKDALQSLGHESLSRILAKISFDNVDNGQADIFLSHGPLLKSMRAILSIPVEEDNDPDENVADNLIYTSNEGLPQSEEQKYRDELRERHAGAVVKDVDNPFAVATATAKKMGHSDFSEGSSGEEKRGEIAEALKKAPESPSVTVDDSRKPNVIMRGEKQEPHYACFFFIKNSFEEILVVRRAGVDRWELPGGLAREDEPIRATLQRQINSLGYRPLTAKRIGPIDMADGRIEANVFTISVDGELILPPKYEEYAWVSTGSVGNVAWTPDYDIENIKELIKGPEGRGLTLSSGVGTDLTKQRDLTDLGDPFQSVGDPYQVQGVLGASNQTREIGDNLKHLRNQVGLRHYEESKGVEHYPLANPPSTTPEEEMEDPGKLHLEDEDEPYIHKFDTQGWDPGHAETINDSRMQERGREPEPVEEDDGEKKPGTVRVTSDGSFQQKAYPFNVNRKEDEQKPISAESEDGEPGQEALSSAETIGSQAFSSGAVIDLPPEMDADKGVQPLAVQGTGYEGVEGGGDGSVVPMMTERTPIPTAEGDDIESDYDARLRRVNDIGKWLTTIKEGGDGGGGGGFGGDGGGGGTAMTSEGTHTATYGGGATPTEYDSSLMPKNVQKNEGRDGENEEDDINFVPNVDTVDSSLEKNAEVYGTTEGLSQLPAPDLPSLGSGDDGKRQVTIERHKPGDAETTVSRQKQVERSIPNEQRAIGGEDSTLVIAEHDEKYKPAELTQKPEHEIVRRKIMDEDDYRIKINDPATEQYTNLDDDFGTGAAPENQLGSALSSVVTNLLSPMLAKSSDSIDTIDMGVMKALVPNKLEKQNEFMDSRKTLVVAGWGNYYVVDQEGHRIGLQGMRKALEGFLANPEYANVNIFHSGIQVGQIIPEFVDANGNVWRTEVKPEGLFVVAALRTDLEVSRKAMREIISGTMRGFSIAGNAKEKELKCDHGKCWTEVTDMEMYEVTLCVQPMNQKSYITDILQMPDPSLCPECYEGLPVEYDSNLQAKPVRPDILV